MWDIGSTTTQIGTLFTQTGTILGYTIPVIISTALAMVGLGFGWRHLKKYVLGKKF